MTTLALLLSLAMTAWSQAPDTRPVIVAFGDSMTAGYGVPVESAYPAQLQRRLDEMGYRYRVVSQGVTGDTSRGGLVRMSRVLSESPDIVILELGSNDQGNGIPAAQTQANLAQMIERFQRTRITVVLAGRNLSGGENVYANLANQYHITLIPSFLAGVSGNPQLTISDGTHPNADGYAIVVKNVLNALQPLLKK